MEIKATEGKLINQKVKSRIDEDIDIKIAIKRAQYVGKVNT